MAKTKTEHFLLALSPEEKALFDKRMEQTGIHNRTAFIKKMCIDGHVIVYDSERINEIGRLLRIESNNINQIARKVNSGGDMHRYEMNKMIEIHTDIRSMFGELLGLLSDVADPKPGKRFIPPMKHSDIEVSAVMEGGQ